MNFEDDKFAWTVKIGEKGQIVIPKEARKLFNFSPGDMIFVLADKNKGLAIPPRDCFINLVSKIFSNYK